MRGRQAQVVTIIERGQKLRPLRDVIILKPLDFVPSETIPTIRKGRPVRGLVKAIGPGHHPWKYKLNAEGQKASMTRSSHYQPTDVKEGDIVELGGLNIYDGQGYSFQEVMMDGELHLICREADVCGVRDG